MVCFCACAGERGGGGGGGGGGGKGLCVENKTGITLHLILCPIVLLNRQAVIGGSFLGYGVR